MKNTRCGILTVFFLVTLGIGLVVCRADAVEDSDSSIHEMPRPDQCSVVTIHIRDLTSSLNQVVKEVSSMEEPVREASESNGDYDQRLAEYRGRVKSLQEQESGLRKEIDEKERRLEECLNSESAPLQK